MSLPTQNIDTRLLHADAAYSTVYALQITLFYISKYLIINKLRNFALLGQLHRRGQPTFVCYCE